MTEKQGFHISLGGNTDLAVDTNKHQPLFLFVPMAPMFSVELYGTSQWNSVRNGLPKWLGKPEQCVHVS